MARRLILILLIVAAFLQTGATCNGTETGNPTNSNDGGEGSGTGDVPVDTATYSNNSHGVTASYESGWSVSEELAPQASSGGDSAGDPTAEPPASSQEGINTSSADSTVFSDGTSTVTLYYVPLSETPASLQAYLEGVFPSRTFQYFANDLSLVGFLYDNVDAGISGGDRREYYFLNGNLLLYIVTDLFETSEGTANFEIFIDSLQFE